MRLLLTVMFLASITLSLQTSPAVHSEKPVVKNSGNLKEEKAQKHIASKDSAAVASDTDKNDPTSQPKEQAHPDSNDRVYSVNVVAQPEPKRDPWFVAYVVITGISVLVGLGTLGLVYRQTSATKLAADAAKKSAEVAESALKLSERADVLLYACNAGGELLDGKDFRVVLQFKNFGRTSTATT
jgi:hypothetical protein